MYHMILFALVASLGSFALSGCAAVVAGTAGALIADEGLIEHDGRFDPFENTALGRRIYD